MIPGIVASSASTLAFSAPLTEDLVDDVAGATPTVVRATAATVPAFDPPIVTLDAGEAGHEGGRRVKNLFTDATNSLAIAAATTAVSVPVGTFVYSMGAGTGTATFSGTATGSSGTLAADATNRSSETLTITVAGTIIVTASVAALVDFQLENVTGQSNQNPGEYVSVGVGTDHGSGVDGVKWYETENGNTVASNVVTEATGAAITAADLLGPRIEKDATNLCWYSDNAANSALWSHNELVAVENDAVAPDGTTTADSIKGTNVYDHHRPATPNITVSSGTTYTASVYAKANDNNFIQLSWFSAYGGHYANFDLNAGTVGTSGRVSGSAPTATIEPAANGFYRCTLTALCDNSSTTVLGYYVVESASAIRIEKNTLVTGFHVWRGQVEVGSYANTPIETAGAAATRDKTEAEYAITLNTNDITIACNWTPQHDTGATDYILASYSDASNYVALMYDGSDVIFRKRIAGSNNDAVKTTNVVAGTTYRLVGRLDSSAGVSLWVDTVKGTDDATTTDAVVGTALELGALNGGSQTTQNVKLAAYHTAALPDDECAAL